MRFKPKNLLPATLFGRSLLILATPLLMTLAITTFIFFDRHWSTTTDRLTTSMAGEINVIAEMIDKQNGVLPLDQERMFEQSFGVGITYDPLQTFTHAKNKMRGLPGLEQSVNSALRNRLNRPYNINTGAFNKENVQIVVGVTKGVLTIEIPHKRLFSTTTYVFLLWMIGAGFILFWISLLFMRNQVRPIKRLALAAEQFGKGHDIATFKAGGAREVRQAAEAFTVMRERIRRQMQQRTEMLAGVSHDLRTPLTRMNLQLAMMPDDAETKTLQRDVKVMQQMIDEYLAFARGVGTEVSSHLDIRDQLRQSVDDARRSGLVVHYTLPTQPVMLKIRPQALQRVFANILQNILIYAGSPHHAAEAWITVQTADDHVTLIFDDNGTGIPADKRDDVFRPFVRLDESRNSASGGVGLGLSIARDIIQSHGGSIALGQAPQGGLQVQVSLPL